MQHHVLHRMCNNEESLLHPLPASGGVSFQVAPGSSQKLDSPAIVTAEDPLAIPRLATVRQIDNGGWTMGSWTLCHSYKRLSLLKKAMADARLNSLQLKTTDPPVGHPVIQQVMIQESTSRTLLVSCHRTMRL